MNIPLNKNLHTVEYWLDQTPQSETWTSIYNIVLFRDTEKEVTISGFDIAYTLLHDFGHFRAYSVESYVDWVFNWERFARIHTHDFERMYTALYADYNPIENYNKQSVIVDDGETGATENAPIVATVSQVADDTVNAANPFIPQSKSITHGKTENNNTRTENTHGNIGVMTNQSMISDELSLRSTKNMITTIVRMFAEMELI